MFWSVARPAGSRQTVDPGKFGSAAGPGSSLGFDSRHRVGCSLGWRLALEGDSAIAAFVEFAHLHNSEFVPPAPPVRPPSVFNVRFHRQP